MKVAFSQGKSHFAVSFFLQRLENRSSVNVFLLDLGAKLRTPPWQ
jgi:hypothetical protein